MIALYQQHKRRILFGILSLLLSITSCILVFPNVAYALTSNSSTEISAVSAQELFRNAYESRYTWDEQFPGYLAEVSIRYDKTLDHGLVRVNPDLSVTTTNIKNEAVRQLVEDQLRMIVTHRRRVPFEALHGKSTFELEGTDKTGTAKIRELGDNMNSQYKLRDQKITQVNRVMGLVAVRVDTLGFIKPPEGYLAAHYLTTFRDAKTGEVLELEDISDNYDRIGKYFLLSNRVIRSSEPGQSEKDRPPDTLIRFNDFQPLPSG